MLNLGEYRRRQTQLTDYLPWACLVDEGIVLNKDGSYQRTLRYRGPDLESATPQELMAISARINNALKRFGSGWALFFEAQRRPATDYPGSVWPNAACWLVDEERRSLFEDDTAHHETDYFLTLCWLTPADQQGRLEQVFVDDPAQAAQQMWQDNLERFTGETRRALDLISDVMPDAAFLGDEETLTYLHSCISLKRHRVAVPDTPMYLDAILADSPLSGGLSPRLGGEALRVVSINGFPAMTEPGLLEDLDKLGFSYRWMTRFLPMDKTEAEKTLGRYRRQWFAKRKSIATILKETLENEPAALVNTDADNKAADADAAMQSLGADHVAFGYLTVAIALTHPDPVVADQRIKLVERIINGRGFVAIHETANAVDAWLGTLPGHAYANVRQPIVHTLNLAHMAPLSALWAGPASNEHLGGPPLLMARSTSGTPFRMVTHHEDVGHTMIVGPTGAGKSVLLSIMAMQFRRYEDAQVFVFDKGRSARGAVLAQGGEEYDLTLDGALSFQPLRQIHEPSELAFAQGWVLGLLEQEGVKLTPDAKQLVWTALQNLAETPIEQRTLTGLSALLQSAELRQALQPFTMDGAYGSLLDADTETLGQAPVAVFEMEALMHDPRLAAPVLSYLFHRLDARFLGAPTLLVLDEAWVFLDHPMFAGRLREWLKTLRKKNVSVVFATQSLADITTSTIAPALIESCPTRIFLPNARAQEPGQAAIYDRFGLNARQVQLVARATPKRDYYMQTPAGNRLFDLELGPVALAFCASGSKADLAEMNSVLSVAGSAGFAVAWLEAKGLEWAGDLIRDEGDALCAAE